MGVHAKNAQLNLNQGFILKTLGINRVSELIAGVKSKRLITEANLLALIVVNS